MVIYLRVANIQQGNTLSELGTAIAKREISRVKRRTPANTNTRLPFYRGNSEEKIELLETAITIMNHLDENPILSQVSQPTLWHTDLHMGNIFVAPEDNDNTQIVSIIDFHTIHPFPFSSGTMAYIPTAYAGLRERVNTTETPW